MEKLIYLLIISIMVNTHVLAQNQLTKVKSLYSYEETISNLKAALEENNLKIFTSIDHAKGAESVSMELNPTTLILFGNPAIGTQLMQCDQQVGIDLPMKYLIWKDNDNSVWIGYWEPKILANKYALEECSQVIDKMSGALAKFASLAAK